VGLAKEDLDQLKSDPGVLRIYGQLVPGLKKAGNKYVGCCPLPGHNDKTPSFNIFPDMRCSCFGCGANLNIFQLIQQVESCDFATAVERVKKELGQSDWESTKQKVESVFKPVAEQKTYKTIPLSAWAKLETALANSKEAVHYLDTERGITLATAQQLRLGFVQTIGSLAGEQGADIADQGWLAFPCVENNQVVGIKYRSIIRKKPGGFARQPGFATALFGAEEIDVFEPVYVVEGEFDQLCLAQAGFHAVSVPSAGTKLTPSMKDQIMRASSVILAGDTDATGSGYMTKLWTELGKGTYLLTWPDGCKDANATFLEHCGRNIDKFRTLVEELTSKAKSQPMPDIYSIQEVMQHGEDTSLVDRADRLRFPWTTVDQMAVLLPGSVLGLTSTNTSMGKTPFVIQASLFGARKYNEVVINWQCELSPSEIAVVVAALVLRRNRNFLKKEDLKEAAEQLGDVQYYIGNNPSITNILDVLDIMEAAIRRTGATVAVLDNLHFYTTGIDDENRVQTAAIKRIKQMAGTYGVKFIVVGQPRKATAQAKGKKTHITDAKGSGSFGDTCDSFMALHRELAKQAEGEDGRNDIYEEKTLVEMLKTRSKGLGKATAYLHFFGEFAAFEALDTSHEENSDA
jgi:hypothetical protein